MSLNSLLRKYYKDQSFLNTLWGYYDSWSTSSSPISIRNALRCKTMALIYEDRNRDL